MNKNCNLKYKLVEKLR